MLILTKATIRSLFSMKEAIQSCKEALRMFGEKNTVVPLRINLDIPKSEGHCLFMPAYAEEINAAGIKIVSVFPGNRHRGKSSVTAQMILLDSETGEVCALLDGTYLTQLRTGALQGLATSILARQNSKIAVIFGAGGQATTQVEAMLNVSHLEEIRVVDIDYYHAQAFADILQEEFVEYEVKITAVKDGNEAIRDADIITTVTTSRSPVFDGSFVKKGVHINGIGSYTPTMQEIPELILQRADKIIFDTTEGVLKEAGDILIPMSKGIISELDFGGDLADLILGKVNGRQRDDEITFFKAVGTAVLDIVAAKMIYTKALEQNVGQTLEFIGEI